LASLGERLANNGVLVLLYICIFFVFAMKYSGYFVFAMKTPVILSDYVWTSHVSRD